MFDVIRQCEFQSEKKENQLFLYENFQIDWNLNQVPEVQNWAIYAFYSFWILLWEISIKKISLTKISKKKKKNS